MYKSKWHQGRLSRNRGSKKVGTRSTRHTNTTELKEAFNFWFVVRLMRLHKGGNGIQGNAIDCWKIRQVRASVPLVLRPWVMKRAHKAGGDR